MMHYLIQTIAFQLLFLMVYDLFLKKETFFSWNRIYLLITPLLSLLLPFIQIESIRESIPENYLIQLPTVLLGGNPSIVAESVANGFQFSVMTVWYVGIFLSAVLFLYKLMKIVRLRRAARSLSNSEVSVKILPKTNSAFTFFNTIYLGEDLSEVQRKYILQHEQIHVRHGHTWDLFLFEVLRISFWFNPLVYIFQKRIGALHEYAADREVALKLERKQYYQEMLSQVFQTDKISFINTFFNHSLIKNRIVMLQKSKSKRIFQLKYLLLVPVVFGMLIYTSCAKETVAQEQAAIADFTSGTQSDILNNIAALRESIAAKGEMTEEEEKALRLLKLQYGQMSKEGGDNLHFGDVKHGLEIPFGVIEKVPVYPGCEGLDNEASRKCFTNKVAAFVSENFDSKKFNGSEISGKQRISVQFKISREGRIVNVKARAAYEGLMEEAIRVVKLLPQMPPGEHDGKVVGVQFALPILFEFNE